MDITYPVASERQRIRDALVEFGMYREWTHWVTLNTHRDLSIDTAYRRLTRWRVEMRSSGITGHVRSESAVTLVRNTQDASSSARPPLLRTS
jgi:hypothetical protein